ncbi:hypothetical protein MLD38_015162 [Melastoma candidum]|uniref:Uncharacterized protein n=1 Tax=Melastoma candidum TaxID=119954 RepID=A0ACB9RIA6_9MYRT|nr:hypothetical protein MLD38_015162 [Melastoma candidum]
MESSGGGGCGGGAFLVKQLASCNQFARERTLRLILKTWLPTQTAVTDDEMKKLWKALFYCVWHADKASYQSQLIGRLSSLLLSLDHPLSLVYFRCFLLTLRREWPGIDFLRLDKFYLLVRRFLASLFELFASRNWDSGFVAGFLDAVFGGGSFEGNGVNYHIASVYLEELRKFLPVRGDVLERVVVGPFIELLERSSDKVLIRKVKSNVFDVFLKNGREFLDAKRSGVEVDPSRDMVVYGAIGLKMGFAARFFELGSSPGCCQGNRKFLLGLHEEFSRLEKELRSSGVDVVMMVNAVSTDCEDEIPELIPINGCSGNALGSKSRKAEKTKKKKKKKNKAGDSSKDVIVSCADDSPRDNGVGDGNLLLDGSVLSNLKLQFEKISAEAGSDEPSTLYESPKVTIACNGDSLKKRKRAKKLSASKRESADDDDDVCPRENVEESYAKSVGSSVKKVRFEMTNNLVWKPHTPLPPQDLRIPPSVTPRGSALKKGLSPGPILETPTPKKKRKQRPSNGKVIRKTAKSVSPAVKQLKKMNSRSL